MASSQTRDTVVILDGQAEPSSSVLREGLADRWVVLEARLDDLGAGAENRLAEAVGSLAPEQYGLVGVSAAASVAIRHALRAPERVSALVLVSPLTVRPAGEPADASQEMEARLGEIRCPTLAVFGQADTLIAPEAASIYRSRIPNCNVAFVYDAAHDIAADRPQALLNLVSDYLERRETFIVQNRSGAINP